MISKFQCPDCQNPIEFEAEHAGEQVACPHCQQLVILPIYQVPPIVPPPSPPQSAAKEAAKLLCLCRACSEAISIRAASCPHCGEVMASIECVGTKIISVLLFLVGGFLVLSGLAGDAESKTVFQQGNAGMEFCAGLILVAMAFLIYGLARLIEATVNRK